MDTLLVMILVLLAMKLVGLLVLMLVDRAPARPDTPDPCTASLYGLPPAPDPETVLLDRLRRGETSRDDYRAAVRTLADRDAGTPTR
ncbi:hypothetical protein [Actinoplanes sp. NBRC 101535]|uniref:hypothetical protein n=1 Tax=Actinoplanes sp. NBRC 101535 TaxID=3032196 RepID=UPI0024A3926E|nr:hypothetical protein [Actinoplanes sp. NBRC 101535]GLY08720.1 hypothetical protein Acsp01_90990 [Actinoplanes sp. NBRC 101535]